jgi:hypothetical protein
VLICDTLPLVDYPNHLARMQLLASVPASPLLQQFYAIQWRPIPDLAMDAIVPPLLALLPLAWAGKLFVLATFLLIAGGTAALHRALFGRWSLWPCLAFLLLYNRLLLWGFLNYLFGLGLAFLALAGMIALARRGPGLRLAAGIVFAFATYFAHLMAFGVYAVLLAGYAAGPLASRGAWSGAALRRAAVALLPLAPPLLLMLFVGAGGGGEISFSKPWRKFDLLFSVFDLYSRPFDIACFAILVGAAGYAYWRRWLVLAPAMAAPVILLGLVYLALPSQLMTASGVDRRIPLALALALCGGSAWVAPRPRLERCLLAGAGLMLVVRLGLVTEVWQASDRDYRAILAGLDEIPVGSRIAVAYPPDAVNVVATPLLHLPVLAAARREAFVPTLFADPAQQPIRLQPAFQILAGRASPDRLWAAFVLAAAPLDRGMLAGYDYIAFAGTRPFTLAQSTGLAPVFSTPRFQLYRLADEPGRR